MSLFERMMRQQMRQQMMYGRRRRRPYGYGWGHPRRMRRRSNVRVGGCCLPIPLGVLTAGAVGVRLATRRHDS